MNKINFDGKFLEGKNVERKIIDIINERDFSGNDIDKIHIFPRKKYYYQKKRYSFDKN